MLRRLLMLTIFFFLFFTISSANAGSRKSFKLQDGCVVVGEVIDEGESGYLVNTEAGEVIRIPYSDVVSVQRLDDQVETTEQPHNQDSNEEEWKKRESREAFAEAGNKLFRHTGGAKVFVANIWETYDERGGDFDIPDEWRDYAGVLSQDGYHYCPIACDHIEEYLQALGVLSILYYQNLPKFISRGGPLNMNPKSHRQCWIDGGSGFFSKNILDSLQEEIVAYCE